MLNMNNKWNGKYKILQMFLWRESEGVSRSMLQVLQMQVMWFLKCWKSLEIVLYLPVIYTKS